MLDTYRKCEALLSRGQYGDALTLSQDIAAPEFRAAILIDAAFALRKSSRVQEGVTLLLDALAPKPDSPVTKSSLLVAKSSLWYNLGNGYSALYSLRRLKRGPTLVPPNDDDLRAAKARYREALAELTTEPGPFRSRVSVNYGNCLSQLGRSIEAIDSYNQAVEDDPTNGMASGNLGIELQHFARLAASYRHDYMLAAHKAVSEALGPNMQLDYGGWDARARFLAAKEEIENFFRAHREPVRPSLPSLEAPKRSLIRKYVGFCRDNGLFLNAWVGDPHALPALSDEVSFGPITTDYRDHNTVPELLRILNEIKESYTTARFLLFSSLMPNDRISALTIYFRTSGMADINGLSLGLLKTAYARSFDVLDKVARIINVYFRVGRREDSFWNLLAVRTSRGEQHEIKFVVRPQVVPLDNYGLYALADICIDYFHHEHVDLKSIDARRNRITHDSLPVVPPGTVGLDVASTIESSELRSQTFRVLRLAKYAILYVLSAINISETRQRPPTRSQPDEAIRTILQYHGIHGQPYRTNMGQSPPARSAE